MHGAIKSLPGKSLLMDRAVGIAVKKTAPAIFQFANAPLRADHKRPGQILIIQPFAALQRVHEMTLGGITLSNRNIIAALDHARAAAFAKQALHRNGDFQRGIADFGMKRGEQTRTTRAEYQNIRAAPCDLGGHHAAPSFSSTAWRRRAASSFTLANRLPPWLSIATSSGPKPFTRNL